MSVEECGNDNKHNMYIVCAYIYIYIYIYILDICIYMYTCRVCGGPVRFRSSKGILGEVAACLRSSGLQHRVFLQGSDEVSCLKVEAHIPSPQTPKKTDSAA